MRYYLLFFFVTVGAKLLLAMLMIYLLFPSDRTCNTCDEETLLVRMGRSGRLLAVLAFGRLQKRWCPRCGWEGFARLPRGTASVAAGSASPARPPSR